MAEIIFRYRLIQRLRANMKCTFLSGSCTPASPPLFAKGSLAKQSKLILLKQIQPLSKERGTIQLKYCEFSGLTCRWF